MTGVPLDILLVDDDGPVAITAAEGLRRRGHTVRVASGQREALAAPAPHVLVSAVELIDGTGLELLAALRARGARTRAVLLGRLTRADEMRAALRLGVCELLERPCALAELTEAVESGPAAPLPEPSAEPSSEPAGGVELRRSLRSEPDEIEDGLRELSAFLVRNGVSPTTRVRAVSAVSEVLDNVRAHAYPDDMQCVFGRAQLRAELSGSELVVHVSDQGQGFESGRDDAAADPREHGLARASALAEDLRVESVLGSGTCVTLSFQAYATDFFEADVLDLCELDWLPPALTRRVLDGIEDGEEPRFQFSTAQAVTVGRLLAGCSNHEHEQRAARRS